MSWDIFRVEYKNAVKRNESDMATLISESYSKCTKLGTSLPGGPVFNGNVDGLKSQLSLAFKSMGAYPFEVALDTGLKLFWLGSSTALGFVNTNPGITSAYSKAKADKTKDLDDYISYLIESFEVYQSTLIFTNPAGALSIGYEIPEEKDSDDGGEPDSAEKTRGTNPNDDSDDKDF